jgi:hypothetical protein
MSMSKELSAIARHPTVWLNFHHDTEAWMFAKYYTHMQSKSETLLSLLDMIDHWRCAPIREIVQEMRDAA